MRRPIAIISGLPQEMAALRAELTAELELDLGGGWSAWQGSLRDAPVVLAQAGMGKVATATLASLLVSRLRPTLLVFTGLAGGLDPALAIGDVVVAERLIQHDYGLLRADALQVYQPGHLPFLDPTDRLGYRTEARLLGLALAGLAQVRLGVVAGRRPRIVAGTIVSGDVFVDSPPSAGVCTGAWRAGRRDGGGSAGAGRRTLPPSLPRHAGAVGPGR